MASEPADMCCSRPRYVPDSEIVSFPTSETEVRDREEEALLGAQKLDKVKFDRLDLELRRSEPPAALRPSEPPASLLSSSATSGPFISGEDARSSPDFERFGAEPDCSRRRRRRRNIRWRAPTPRSKTPKITPTREKSVQGPSNHRWGIRTYQQCPPARFSKDRGGGDGGAWIWIWIRVRPACLKYSRPV